MLGITAWSFACGVTDNGDGDGNDKSADGDGNGDGLLNGNDTDGDCRMGVGADVKGLTDNDVFRT